MKQKNALSNKYLTLILALLFALNINAQRDYELTENRNPWLLSGNAAALMTYGDSSISKASVSYAYEGGRYRSASAGKNEMMLCADARSYYHLSEKVMGYGSVTYTNFSGTEMSGSMLSGYRTSILPFDIKQSDEDAGRKHMEMFNVAGGVGVTLTKGLSIGAKADFSAGTYAKYKDLRHSNKLMNLDAAASILFTPYTLHSTPSTPSTFPLAPSPLHHTPSTLNYAIGASFLYGRSTETIKYKTYGTTDHIYKALLDYANGYGETLTYGGDGFIDENTELPLFDERCGFSIDAALTTHQHPTPTTYHPIPTTYHPIPTTYHPTPTTHHLSFKYLHRHGYYGRESQYTASYEQHSGNSYGWDARFALPQTRNTLSWLDLHFTSEGLTTYKTNYLQTKSEQNTSVIYYAYYSPTKIADKTLNSGSLAYTLYLKPKGEIYLWNINAGTHFLYSKQTAYLYPEMLTRKVFLWTPYVRGKRNFVFPGSSVLGIDLAISAQCGNMDIQADGIGREIREQISIGYEFPLLHVRPSVSLRYSCAQSNDASYPKEYRHLLMLSVGTIF